MKKPTVLIIRDGWGVNPLTESNAVASAHTLNIDSYKHDYPWSLLQASGEFVGLPKGFMGSSEVGHMNIGAGRIVEQELKKINDQLESGEFFRSANWQKAMTNWQEKNSQLHLLGLLQDEGVHAHQSHLFALMRKAHETFPAGKIIIHPFLDGRDTAPRSCEQYLTDLQKVLEETGAQIGTVMGRYYGMDRGKNWQITDQAYATLVCAEGQKSTDVFELVKQEYATGKCPDNSEMTDEYIPPYVLDNYAGMNDGDVVIHTNYRQDRALQLTQAFVSPDYPGKLCKKPEVLYFGFTQYYDEFQDYLLEVPADAKLTNLFGQVLADNNLKQLRIAETQKIKHVTSFFNGKSTTPFPNETDIEIPSRFDPATFAEHPEMEAYNVTEKLLAVLPEYDVVIVNYANCDMVGHTGNFASAVKAVEIVDECVGKVVEKVLELGGECFITADHGNADQMENYQTHKPMTSHTTYPVELIWVSPNAKDKKLSDGKLGDIAPTMLSAMGLNIPADMTGNNLINS